MIIPGQTITACNNSMAEDLFQQALRDMPLHLPKQAVGEVCRCEIGRVLPHQIIADLMSEQSEVDKVTEHAWLVVLGHFAQALGLVAQLEEVPVGQKQTKHTPQSKLIEFLVGILGNIAYLEDLNQEAHPIAGDVSLAQAWGQALFAHYSGVSRTLDAADEETLTGIIEVLREISRPFVQQAVLESIQQRGYLLADVDLSGREVSPTSTDYEEASFGWMDDDVRKGYQMAISTLVSKRWERLLVNLRRYTGRTHSAECLQTAVQDLEQVLGVRPRRRTELVDQRQQQVQAQIQQAQQEMERDRQRARELWAQSQQYTYDVQALQAEIAQLEADYQAQGRVEKPHSQLAKARDKRKAVEKRQSRARRELDKLADRWIKRDEELRTLHSHQTVLQAQLTQLQADNLANPNPVPIVLRIDAGFSTGLNLAWLIEMGYTVLTKAHHSSISNCLLQRLPENACWERVGRNAEAVAMGDYYQNDCHYPLQAMLVRYHLPDELRHTTLFYYANTPPPSLPQWFSSYNGRQTIEAGIKETKGVFTLKRHLVRSPFGMQIQEQFAAFAANFVRWATDWVRSLLRQANPNFREALQQVKTLTRRVSRARARWICNHSGSTLIFDEHGPFAKTILCLSGQVAVQLVLPLFNFADP